MSWHQFWYSNHICLSYGQSDCEIFPQLINAFCFYENSAVLICSFYPNLCKQYYLKNLVLIDLPEAHQDFLVGVIGSFWHKIKNFWGSKFESVHIARIIFFHIDLTTWPNLTKFCSLTLAGASPRTPLWTLGCSVQLLYKRNLVWRLIFKGTPGFLSRFHQLILKKPT
jgi:hypothetical protein